MNAERLLTYYGRIADTTGAIPLLRRFVLDLAVRGKLVEQSPNDEPAPELCQHIPQAKLDQADLPTNWHQTTIGTLLDFQYGKGLKPSHRTMEGPVPVYGSNGIVGYTHEPLTTRPSVIVGRKGSAGALNLCDGPSWTTDVAYYVEAPSFLELRFLYNILAALRLDKLGKGVKPGLSRSDAYEQVICVPPLAEQHRIVTKVDELMALCDRLEVARTDREMTRDRLTVASHARLNAPHHDPTTFENHAVFALENLTSLTTCPEQIETLRQTILNLAIRGKLVAQDPKDEPASALLERTASNKARLVKNGEIRKDKRRHPVTKEQGNFPIPPGWSWCRLGNLSKVVTSGSRDWAKYYSEEGAVFVRMGNLSKDHYRLRLDNIQRVKAPSDGEGTRTRLEAGDLLISITGDVGMLGFIPENFGEAYINQHTAMVRPMDDMKGRYLPELFRSPFAQQQFNAPQRGIKNSFRLTDITDFLVPLPPLAEQHRIVAKIDELMALCGQLEESLSTAADTRRRLLDAVLHDALEPSVEPNAAA